MGEPTPHAYAVLLDCGCSDLFRWAAPPRKGDVVLCVIHDEYQTVVCVKQIPRLLGTPLARHTTVMIT